ncbi:MAG TPA: Omp28-related outer membrane protein [Chitinophagaceae bacterium]|nr:Omp28-related outer membrane protein [Chitinophagaceae bacterium]
MNLSGFYILCSMFLFMLSCSKGNENAPPKELRVTLNNTVIYSDLLDELVVTVLDADNNDITSSSRILIDNSPINGNRFKTADIKTFSVKADINGKESDPVSFKSIRHEINNFSKKVIMEEFAGTWCSFCTRFTYLIDTMVRSNNKIIPVQVHSGDVFEYGFVQQMRSKFGVGSFPFGYLNRGQIWDESMSMVQGLLNSRTKLGLAINSTINNNIASATVKVKFDVTTSESLSIVVVLLEDSLIYPQSNFYNTTFDSPFYGLGDPIQNYRHNNVLRAAATDIFGDVIPITVQKKGETWEKSYSLNASGYNLANCKIVAYVQYTQNNVSRWGVLNAQIVKAGSNIAID